LAPGTGRYDMHEGFGELEVFRRVARRIQDDPHLLAWIVVAAVLLGVGAWGLFTAFYTVDVQENAVVLRFGRLPDNAVPIGSGLHLKIPFGVDKVYKAKVAEVKKQEFGYRTLKAGVETEYEDMPSLALTGDLNVANVRWVVRYKINDLAAYLFNLRDAEAAVRDVSEAVMRRVVGDYSVDEVLTVGRQEIQMVAQNQMQELLSQYRAGVHIVAVRLQESTPPEEVRDAFNEVNQALQEKDRLIQEAEAQRNREIPAARGQRERVVLEAEGYKIEKVNNAQGEVKQFEAVLERYLKAKDITRQRLYLETMAKILPKAGRKYIIEGGGGVLKLLPLEMPGAGQGGGR